jgi:hypothetical protein
MAICHGLSPPCSAAFDWNLFEAHEDTHLAQSAEERGVALIAQGILERLDQISMSSEDKLDERSEVDSIMSQEPVMEGLFSFGCRLSFNIHALHLSS